MDHRATHLPRGCSLGRLVLQELERRTTILSARRTILLAAGLKAVEAFDIDLIVNASFSDNVFPTGKEQIPSAASHLTPQALANVDDILTERCSLDMDVQIRLCGQHICVNSGRLAVGDQTLKQLRSLYIGSVGEYLVRLVLVLLRYDTLTGSHTSNQQLSIEGIKPSGRVEVFASPINTSEMEYCSLFADTDVYFGSRGRWPDAHVDFSKERVRANPPFIREIQDLLVRHLKEAALILDTIVVAGLPESESFDALHTMSSKSIPVNKYTNTLKGVPVKLPRRLSALFLFGEANPDDFKFLLKGF